MLRKLLLAVAFALPVATIVGSGATLPSVAHAQATGPGAGSMYTGYSCGYTSYSALSSGPYYMDNCDVGGGNAMEPGNYIDSLYQNEVGTVSLQGEGCLAASITTGKQYYNPTGFVNFIGYNPNTGLVSGQARCTVQTGDTGITRNLFATLYCSFYGIGLFNYAIPGSETLGPYGYINIYETESTTGVVTASLNVSFYIP